VRFGCLALLAGVVLALLLPWLFADVMATALLKLNLSPRAAAWIALGILFGGLVNVPVRRIERVISVPVEPWALFGFQRGWPTGESLRAYTIVAVNVGGCVIPTCLAGYEAWSLAPTGAAASLVAAVLVNVAVCYRLARPKRGIGILLPWLAPPALAAISAVLLAPEHATPIAFVSGTLGPLIGADLLHLREIERLETGMLSIGGAGTFDGIVLSGIVALYLA
jgi:uncharacterized membrane protein